MDKKILVIHQGALGDFVLAFPVLLVLQDTFDRIDLLCQQKLGKLACRLNLAHHAFALESAVWASLFTDEPGPQVKHLLSGYNRILLFSFSAELENTLKQLFGGRVCRIPPRPSADAKLHVGTYLLQGLANCSLGVGLQEKLSSPSRFFTDRRNRPFDAAKIVLHPGSGSRRKNWPLSFFLETEMLLRAHALKPVFLLGPAEDFMQAELCRADGPVRAVYRFDDLIDGVELLRSAAGFIGNDSGITHLAAFLGLPCVAVFGPTDPVRWAPRGKSVAVLKPDPVCTPCFEQAPDNCDRPVCLESISPQTVCGALLAFMRPIRS